MIPRVLCRSFFVICNYCKDPDDSGEMIMRVVPLGFSSCICLGRRSGRK